MFLFVIMGATHGKSAPPGLRAAWRLNSALTLIHLVSIPVTNTSVDPARSTGPALFAGAAALVAALAVLGRAADRPFSPPPPPLFFFFFFFFFFF